MRFDLGLRSNGLPVLRKKASNLVTNGDFANGLTGWTASSGNWSVVSGQAVMGSTSAATPLTQVILTVGVSYTATFDVIAFTGTNAKFHNGAGTVILSINTTGPKSATFTATDATIGFSRNTAVATTLTIDNVVVVPA